MPTIASTRSGARESDPLDDGAAHRVADEREAVGAELVGDGEQVTSGLLERLVALLASALDRSRARR